MSYPKKQGLYDPKNEKENCGIGFVANIKGRATHEIIRQGIEVLNKLEHRGACGSDPLTGDGAGLLIQMPHKFFKSQCPKLISNCPNKENTEQGLSFSRRMHVFILS